MGPDVQGAAEPRSKDLGEALSAVLGGRRAAVATRRRGSPGTTGFVRRRRLSSSREPGARLRRLSPSLSPPGKLIRDGLRTGVAAAQRGLAFLTSVMTIIVASVAMGGEPGDLPFVNVMLPGGSEITAFYDTGAAVTMIDEI